MKKPETLLKEYVSKLSEDDLDYLDYRLEQRMGSDLAEALELLSESPDIDKWLKSAESCDEIYDMIDLVQMFVRKEFQRKETQAAR